MSDGQRLWIDGFGVWYDSPDDDARPIATNTGAGFQVTRHGHEKGWTTTPDGSVLLSPDGQP
jgi:hypothetical protein